MVKSKMYKGCLLSIIFKATVSFWHLVEKLLKAVKLTKKKVVAWNLIFKC